MQEVATSHLKSHLWLRSLGLMTKLISFEALDCLILHISPEEPFVAEIIGLGDQIDQF